MLASTGIILSKEDLDDIMLEFDEDGNGTIEFEEFVQIFVKIM
jgi:Ca2+-binding EF-hand superfamily protein